METHVVVVLLHGNHPRNIVEGDGTQAEVGVVGDLAHLLDKGVEGRRGDAVDSGDEVGRGESVVVGRGATAL